jgi:penicillin-binding protein 2
MVLGMSQSPISRAERLRILVRVRVAGAVITVALAVLLSRLWILQIVKGGEYRNLSETNRIETVFVSPPRGHITDRFGRLLVSNRPAYNLEVTRENVHNFKEMWKILAPILGITEAELQDRFKHNQANRRRYESTPIARDISREVVAQVMSERFRLPGVRVSAVPSRDYLFGSLASQVLGYTREISHKQLSDSKFSSYKAADTVGQVGLEDEWEEYLQGRRGKQQVIVNAAGWRVGELSSEQETIGNSLETTLDLEIQSAAEEQLKNKKGSVVMLEARSGEVLAMASSPGYDPNVFSGDLSASDWKQIISEKRLVNKAIQGGYPPGSIFKPLLAVAGLQEGLITPSDRVHCPGYYSFARRSYGCWKKSGHGSVDLKSALRMSCDVYFYSLGHRLGIDRIKSVATDFGLGLLTGLGSKNEGPGLIPSKEWKKKAFKNRSDQTWFPGETLSVAIGQGAVMVTPLQMARAYAALVNGGLLIKPRLVRRVNSRDGHVIVDSSVAEVQQKTKIKQEHLSLVHEGLIDVVEAPGGTGGAAKLQPALNVRVGGKTGTAQVASLKYHAKKGQYEDHAWFVGFAPADNPKVVVAVLIENGGHGGSAAAPIAQALLAQFFSKQEAVQGGS